MSEYDVLQQKLIELQEELANLRRSEYIARAGKAQAVDTQFPDALLHLPFDGGAPYERDFSVNLYGHKLQRPTVYSGGIIGRPGKFGKAVQLAEATTNLVTNPSFEVDTAGWTYYSMTYARSTEWAKFGSASVKITGEANDGYLRTNDLYTVPNGGTVTAQAWVNTQAGGSAFALRITTGSTSRAAVYASGIGEEWLTCSWTNDTGSDQAVRIQLYDRGVAAGQVAYFDGVQLEAKAYPTPYADGSLGLGHAWTGTPHQSNSTRTVPTLDYSSNVAIPPSQFSVSYHFYAEHQSVYNATSNSRGLISLGNNINGLLIYLNPGSHPNQLVGRWASGGSISYPSLSGATLTAGVWHHLVVTYDGVTLRSYLDGSLVIETTRPVWTAPTTDLLLGRAPGAAANPPAGIRLDDLLILDRALTPTEVRRLYEAGQAGLGVLCPPQSWQPLVGAGAPTWGYPGMTYIDTTNNRWYVNVDGTWRYTGLT